MNMTEILILSIVGYLLLNCLLSLAAVVFSSYLRHKKGLSLMEFPNYEEMSSKERIEDLKNTFIAPIILLLFFVPIVVLLGAHAIAGNIEINEEGKK